MDSRRIVQFQIVQNPHSSEGESIIYALDDEGQLWRGSEFESDWMHLPGPSVDAPLENAFQGNLELVQKPNEDQAADAMAA